MNVIISPNIKRQKAMVNMNGDEVVPFTKEVIRSANEGSYIPTKAEREAIESASVRTAEEKEITAEDLIVHKMDNITIVPDAPELTIQEQIDEAEAHLAALKVKKQEAIAEMKKQLAMLESE